MGIHHLKDKNNLPIGIHILIRDKCISQDSSPNELFYTCPATKGERNAMQLFIGEPRTNQGKFT